MAKSHDSFGKRETEKRKQQKKKEKEQRREERKANAGSGRSLDDMIAYVDENGNITSTPPDPTKKKEISTEDIVISVARQTNAPAESTLRTGTVTFFNNSKGYGFIKDSASHDSVFIHINELTEAIQENDKVTFETKQGFKGPQAYNVTVIK